MGTRRGSDTEGGVNNPTTEIVDVDNVTNVKMFGSGCRNGPIYQPEKSEHPPFFPFLSPSLPTSGAGAVVMASHRKEKVADSAAGEGGGRGVVAVELSAGHVIGAADSVTRRLPLALLWLNTADLLWHNPPPPFTQHPCTNSGLRTILHHLVEEIHQLPFHQLKAEWVHLSAGSGACVRRAGPRI